MSERILVVGLGRFGSALALGLAERGCDVVAVDVNMELVEAVKDRVGYAMQLDATDPLALRSIDASSCSAAVVAMGEQFESKVLSVAALKECGIPRVIARSRDATQSRILKAIGATEVIEVESDVGRRLAQQLAEWGR